MPFRIAVISDLHYADRCASPKRKGEWATHLLTQVVRRLNNELRPDVVAILGDLVDKPGTDDLERLRQLRGIIDQLHAPTITIPGNHDPDPDRFYQVMKRPEDTIDIGNARFLTFVDAEEPGYHASRNATDLDRMHNARVDGHTGPIVMLQHVPVLPPRSTDCPYAYTNILDVLTHMDEQCITLSVGGHYHRGTQPVRRNHTTYLCVKALCEEPFTFTLIDLGDETIVQELTVEGPK